MYTHPDSHFNRFKLVKIPSAKDLAETLKPREPIGHNDPADEIPDNLNDMDNLDLISAGSSILNNLAVDAEIKEEVVNEPDEPTEEPSEVKTDE